MITEGMIVAMDPILSEQRKKMHGCSGLGAIRRRFDAFPRRSGMIQGA